MGEYCGVCKIEKNLHESETIDSCCVCLENTCQKTKCNHELCIECCSSLKKNICPMCRKKLM